MRQLHMGDYQTLNVYMVEGAGGGVCSLPNGTASYAVDQDLLNADGCFVPLPKINGTVSGTLTHEVGHWFGLLHVFQGGCTGDGDYCDDTAPQAEASYGKLAKPGDINSCPAKQSCKAGVFDNVLNYMDYTDCSHEFTPCQGGRMSHSWTNYRDGRKLADGVQVRWE
ncbi:pregnancy-associated plasma protein-A-domain-containing protein [Lophiotrema nucula]|uniref:Pregnancy-associated plasma protein-A-domain-containing protein n=1 Tax=Lophiotrema nucula TaxID=690887 RepID=A0A6A5YZI2_9PLEO|nr:pregnancy-associated plasma protein-A-domain-containing protein [Lophiotrema nucula]